MEPKSSGITTVSIPIRVANKTKVLIQGTGFHSLSSFVTFVLRQILSTDTVDSTGLGFPRQQEQEIKNRLKKLGYL